MISTVSRHLLHTVSPYLSPLHVVKYSYDFDTGLIEYLKGPVLNNIMISLFKRRRNMQRAYFGDRETCLPRYTTYF